MKYLDTLRRFLEQLHVESNPVPTVNNILPTLVGAIKQMDSISRYYARSGYLGLLCMKVCTIFKFILIIKELCVCLTTPTLSNPFFGFMFYSLPGWTTKLARMLGPSRKQAKVGLLKKIFERNAFRALTSDQESTTALRGSKGNKISLSILFLHLPM